MIRQRSGLFAVLAAVAMMTLVVACSDDSSGVEDAIMEELAAISATNAQLSMSLEQAQSADSDGGILVTGEGRISVEPDLAMVNVGIEAQAETVSQARTEAAEAMARVVAAVEARGLSDADIQTASFNIRQEYQYEDIERNGSYVSERRLVGYLVSNFASIKVRDLDSVGPVIDDVAEAGGDLTRIHGISLTVEDPKPFMEELRREAFEDARDKAEQLAALAGATLGEALSISEYGAADGLPGPDVAFLRQFVAYDYETSTSISGGETELRLTVTAQFAIEP